MEKEMRTLVDYFNMLRSRNTYEACNSIEVTGGDLGHIEMTFKTEAGRHANFRGQLHGAVLLGFSDTLMGTSCFTLSKSVVTLELKGNFVQSMKAGEVVRGVANVEHNGNRTMVCTCRCYNNLGELTYMATGTFFVLDKYELPQLPWRL